MVDVTENEQKEQLGIEVTENEQKEQLGIEEEEENNRKRKNSITTDDNSSLGHVSVVTPETHNRQSNRLLWRFDDNSSDPKEEENKIAIEKAVLDVEKQALFNRTGCQMLPNHILVGEKFIVGFVNISEEAKMEKQHWLVQCSQIASFLNLNINKGNIFFHNMNKTEYPILSCLKFDIDFSSTSIKNHLYGPDNKVYTNKKSGFNTSYLRFIVFEKGIIETDPTKKRERATLLMRQLFKEIIKMCQGDKFTKFYVKLLDTTMENYMARPNVKRSMQNISDIFKKMILRDANLIPHLDTYFPCITIEDILRKCKVMSGDFNTQAIIESKVDRGWEKQKVNDLFVFDR